MNRIKVLFLAPYPVDEPVTRFRMFQYVPFLSKKGIDIEIDSLMGSHFYKIKNKTGLLINLYKMFSLILSCLKRLAVFYKIKNFDLVYISKEIFPFGPPFFEKAIAKKLNLIYDFDDAVFISSEIGNWRRIWLDPNRVANIIKMATFVVPGNEFLASYALNFTSKKKVRVLLTPIDTEKYKPADRIPLEKNLVIGWIGTWRNVEYLFSLREVFKELSKSNDFILKIVGPDNIFDLQISGVKIKYKLWKLEDEPDDIASFDIGIMPLDNNDWAKGKCGFKIIQYMACGIPTVASPVGVNCTILKDGKAGFLASNSCEWVERLTLLLHNQKLRKQMGQYARKTAEEKYSVLANGPILEKIIKDAVSNV